MTASWVASSTDVGATSAAPTRPTGTASGDLIFAHVQMDSSTRTISTPTGWTALLGPIDDSQSGDSRHYLFHRYADLTSDDEPTWTASGSTQVFANLHAFTGVVASSPIDVTATATPASGSSQTGPTMTTTVDDTLVINFVGDDRSTAITPPAFSTSTSGWTKQVESGPTSSQQSAAMADFPQATAGSVTQIVWTLPTSDACVILQVAIISAGGAGTQDLAPSSITSAQAFGTAVVTTGAVTVTPSAIASAEAHGTATVTTGAVTVAPSGIATEEAFGNATVGEPSDTANELEAAGVNFDFEDGLTGWDNGTEDVVTPLVGVRSLTFDDAVSGAFTLGPFTVTSGVKVFALWLRSSEPTAPVKVDFYLNGFSEIRSVTFTATSSAAQYVDQVTFTDDTIDMINVGWDTLTPAGTITIDELSVQPLVEILPSGISSGEGFGTPAVSPGAVSVSPTGIASAGAIGTPTVTPGAVSLSPSSITSAEAFGTPELTTSQPVAPTAIDSAEAFGTPTLTLDISPVGIASAETFGEQLRIGRQVFILEAPVVQEEGPPPYYGVTRRVNIPRGLTTYRVNGTWYSGRNLNRELENADRIYRGGYDHQIDDEAERAELIAAGYTFETRMT